MTALPLPRARLLQRLEQFAGTPVALWGDFVVDRFLLGRPKRISREAPVLILSHESELLVPGGGGNALMNLAALGARPIALGAVGAGPRGQELMDLFRDAGIEIDGIVAVPGWETPTKTRVLAGFPHGVKQQVVRFDRESPLPDPPAIERQLADRARRLLAPARAVILSDYGYGAVSPATVEALRALPGGDRPILVDSRFGVRRYLGVDAATPNEEEAATAAGLPLDQDDAALHAGGAALREAIGAAALLVTRGSRGSALFEPGAAPVLIPVHGGDQVADVTGAGDTVIATFALARAAGASWLEAAVLADIAGGIVVMKSGTATVTVAEIARGLAVEDRLVR